MKVSFKRIYVYAFFPILSLVFTRCNSDSKVLDQVANKAEITTLSEADLIALREDANLYFASISSIEKDTFPKEKIALGKMLYHDTRLSLNGTISCASCHNLNTYGVDNLPTSPGDTKEFGARNSPSSVYAYLHGMQFWDGRAKDVEEQAGGPLLNPVEHALPSAEFLENKLRKVEEYKTLFKEVYPDEKQPITFENITNAIGAFERQLNPIGRFDNYLDGDENALTMDEKKGLKTFIDKGCIACHSGVALGGQMLQQFGVNKNYWEHTKSENVDEGRFEVTENENDKYFFKVPGLRNIAETYPYFHDGSVSDLTEAVRIMSELQIAHPLTEEEIQNVVTFLKSLTAEVDREYRPED